MRQGAPSSTRHAIEPKDERTEAFVEFAPKVEGLVPYLVAAANDEVKGNLLDTWARWWAWEPPTGP